MAPLVTPVILSGGSGTRLWPLSRASRPKQLLPLFAPETMLQLTAARFADPERFAAPLIVANLAHADEIERQLARPDARLILEPAGRNTAPAIALAALAVEPDALLLVCPSDHRVGDVPAFHRAVATALPAAEAGWLVTFGIRPTHPETGYGYVRRGAEAMPGVFAADAFVEKPDFETAKAYLASGEYSWNGGIFLFRADAYLQALETHAPDVLAAVRRAMASAPSSGRVHPGAAAFASAPSVSIDYAVMEKADRVAVVPTSMDWSDLGSWDALHQLAVETGAVDTDGNGLSGQALAIGSDNNLIRAEGTLVAAVGVDNLIIVATRDAVLIMPRGESQRVKQAIEALQASDHPTLTQFS